MNNKHNPYVNPDTEQPVLQFNLEAKVWDEGYGACRKDDFAILADMHNTLLEMMASLRRVQGKYAQRMARGVND